MPGVNPFEKYPWINLNEMRPKPEVTIYHNPRCSTSRKALEWLHDRGIEPKIFEYLKENPGESELRDLLAKLKASPREIIRKKEQLYMDLGLKSATDDELIRAMADNPVLIERPIVIRGNRAAIGRPLENIENLF